MLKKTVTKIANSKIFYIIISIVISLLLWLYVINVENKEITEPVSGIPVEFIGKDGILVDRGLLISGEEFQTVDITFFGQRSIVSKLNKENVKVTVDLTDIRSPGVYQKRYEVQLPKGELEKDVSMTERYPQYIVVSIDRRMEKSIPVRGNHIGTVEEGFIAEELEFNPEYINISGPENIITKISHAEITVKRENLKETIMEQKEYVFKDESGNVVESNKIIADVDTVEVKLPVLLVKEVALTVDIVPGGGAAKENAKVVVEPGTITLSGDPDLMKGINQLSLGTINLAEIGNTYRKPIPIPIPNGVTNISGESSAEVNIEILGLSTKKLSSTNFEIINVPSGYTASVASQKPLEITIRGPAEDVALVGSHNIRIVCDLSDIEEVAGMKSFYPTVYVDGYEDVGVLSKYENLVISLTKE